MTEKGASRSFWFVDWEYQQLCARECVLSDSRSLSAANFLSLASEFIVDPVSSEEQCLRLAGLAEDYGVDPDMIQSVLEQHEPSLACTQQFRMIQEED